MKFFIQKLLQGGFPILSLATSLFVLTNMAIAESKINDGFSHYVGVKKFSNFKKTTGTNANEIVLTSPEFSTPISWDELVVSWNATTPAGTYLKIEACGIYPDHTTKFYTLGLWSPDAELHPRESVKGQKDDDGKVSTDTLMLRRTGAKVQVRITLGSSDKKTKATLKYIGLSFCNSKATPSPQASTRKAWGKEITVIERSQNAYPEEQGWCSATSVSMALTHWSDILKRKEMALDVPEVARLVVDKNFGTGNWPFNVAFAGSFDGMRAYVSRFSDIAELESWIERGIPVVISSPYHLLAPGRKNTGSGHVVLVVGFTETGDVVINDPATNLKKDRVRHVYKRADVTTAWKTSNNTVYLIYPEPVKIPKNTLGHWDNK